MNNKYHARKVVIDDMEFDSQREAKRYTELKLLLKAGLIRNLELQPKYPLQDSFKQHGKTYRAITYIADFRYIECASGAIVIEDVKGCKTEVFKIKEKLFRFNYPELDFRIVK